MSDELTGKELVIAVAQKLGKEIGLNPDDDIVYQGDIGGGFTVKQFLHHEAAEILFSEGMAGKIVKFIRRKSLDDNDAQNIPQWFLCEDNNGTLAPEKILNIWLQMDEREE